MLILAFESSAKAAGVALLKDGDLLAQSMQISGLTHSQTLLPMAEDLLKNTGIAFEDIDRFAVAHGPGSFTGIRIGIATVKGMAWASDKDCVGVSTLEAMAYNGISAGGIICCCMDARRSQIYNAKFRFEDGKLIRLCEDRAIALSELEPDEDMFLVGDGASITADYLREQNISFRLAPPYLLHQTAYGVGKAAEGKTAVKSGDILPVYLRLSQAERERQERLNEKRT